MLSSFSLIIHVIDKTHHSVRLLLSYIIYTHRDCERGGIDCEGNWKRLRDKRDEQKERERETETDWERQGYCKR